MTLAIHTRAKEGKTLPPPQRPFLDPAVDTPLKGVSQHCQDSFFSAICRTFRSGGTRIRTGDTMIFSHMQKPLGMRKTRVGKQVCVQEYRRYPLVLSLLLTRPS